VVASKLINGQADDHSGEAQLPVGVQAGRLLNSRSRLSTSGAVIAGGSVPYFIHPVDGGPLVFAGLGLSLGRPEGPVESHCDHH